MQQSATITPPTNTKSEGINHTDPSTDKNSERLLIPLAMNFEELLGDDPSPDETADEMIQTIRQWRDAPSGRRLD